MQTYEEKPKKFKAGQIVKHKNIDEAIRVKKSNPVVTVLERINQPKFKAVPPPHDWKYPVYIVATKNLFI